MLNSTNKKSFRLVNTPKLSAKENMRIDRELFETFSSTELPVLRVYSWESSFTYGVSQKIEDFKHFENLKVFEDRHAKRMTGGGILFHGNDISYSLVIPTSYVEGLSVKKSYELICSFLLAFYKAIGLEPKYAKDSANIELSHSAYCQEGFEPYDILIEGKKIGGNAQRRAKEVIFQHGSIAIDNRGESMGASLEDVGVRLSYDEAKELLAQSFAKCFNVEFKEKNEDVRHAS